MPIFNSLGSNYSFQQATLALKQIFKKSQLTDQTKKLIEDLQARWSGQVVLTAKGRDALHLVLESLDLKSGDQILTQAFGCYALEQVIDRAGAKLVFVDSAPGKLNFSVTELKQALADSTQAKAVIVQHSLGYPAQIDQINQFCQQQNLILIEDLAQVYGAKGLKREPLGKLADYLVLSFGKDKILDGVQGGAAIFKTTHPTRTDFSVKVSQKLINRDLFYPVFTTLIRQSYYLGLGRIFHRLAKNFNLMPSSVKTEIDQISGFPSQFAPLVLNRLDELKLQLEHRTKLAHLYFNQLQDNDYLKIPVDRDQIRHGTNLRFPILVPQPEKLIKFLKKNRIFLADRWYRRPSDSGSLNLKSQYQAGQCPNAENLSQAMVNLPTHQLIDVDAALGITQFINQFND